jgi:hypothetical protein
MEMSAEEYAVQEHIGGHQIILVSPVLPLVLIALDLELMTVTVV